MSENPKRKLPADAKVMNWAEKEARRYEDLVTASYGGRTHVNKIVVGKAQDKYGGAMHSVRVITSEGEITIYLVLGGPLPEDVVKNKKKWGDRIPIKYDKRTGTSFDLPLKDALAELGIEVPVGRICEIPVTVEEVEGTGWCIILDVKHKEFKASKRGGKKDEEEEQQEKNSSAASAKMDKPQEKK